MSDRYAPWAVSHLRRGQQWVDRIEAAFSDALPRDLSEINAAWVDQWWLKRIAAVSRATASRDLACLRAAMNKATKWGVLDQNPLSDLQIRPVESRRVVRFLNQSEERMLRQALADRDAAMIASRESGNSWRIARSKPLLPVIDSDGFGDHLTPVVLLAMNTGLRRGELLSLNWTDVDFDARILTVRSENAKNGRQRHIPLNAEATGVLRSWVRRSTGAGVFDIADIKTAWNSLIQSAGLEKFRFHDLRHHFASKLVMAGVDLNTVRELLGHSDIKMTLRYSHLGPDHLAAAVAKLSCASLAAKHSHRNQNRNA
ncbi:MULTISPECIES: tyrosine-type recombinase/integrase [Lysobacteraceae]|uniref:tyrosine-type recombinase/integrase n=1 Tax=Lysobacteraceae TaxID=32033 RepID=UPI001FD55323|nr:MULTISPECIES: site-specific integrase [Lysobacter]